MSRESSQQFRLTSEQPEVADNLAAQLCPADGRYRSAVPGSALQRVPLLFFDANDKSLSLLRAPTTRVIARTSWERSLSAKHRGGRQAAPRSRLWQRSRPRAAPTVTTIVQPLGATRQTPSQPAVTISRKTDVA